MKLLTLSCILIFLTACNPDTGTPSSLLNTVVGTGTITTEDPVDRVEPANFGVYEQVINSYPYSRRNSLFRAYKKQGRNYILQSDFDQEISLTINLGEQVIKLIFNKDSLSSSKIGNFILLRQIEGDFIVDESLTNHFRLIEQDSPILELTMESDTDTTTAYLIKRDEQFIYQLADGEFTAQVEKTSVEEVSTLVTYINSTMLPNASCKKLTAGNIVNITTYTTDASKSEAYRNCYWDIYDQVIKKFVQAHQDAVQADDAKGKKCRSRIFSKIKKELRAGKAKCQSQFGN